MKFNVCSLTLLPLLSTLLGAAPVVAQATAKQPRSRHTPASHTAPQPLVAEAPIWGPNDAFDGYAYLPVTVHGHAGTLLIDLNCTECDIKLGNDGLQAAGMPALAEDATVLDSMTIGPAAQHAVQHGVPIGVWPTLGPVPTPPNIAPIIGSVGVHFLTTHYDLLYDFPNRVVRLYAPPATPVTSTTAWLPPGFTPAHCGPMVPIPSDPPGAATFTGMQIQLDGHPAIAAIEMGPYYLKMNQAAFAVLGLPASSARITPITDDPSVPPGTRDVTGVQVTVGENRFDLGKIQHWPEVGIQQAFAPNTPILLMNLNTLRRLRLYNARSSKQVCLASPTQPSGT